MVFVRAFTGTPATAAHDVAACGVNDVFLVLTIQDGHPAVPAALANTQVTVILGALNQAVTTDGNGNLTLAYNAHADYTPNAVTAVPAIKDPRTSRFVILGSRTNTSSAVM